LKLPPNLTPPSCHIPQLSHYHHSFVFQCHLLQHPLSMSTSNACCVNVHFILFHQQPLPLCAAHLFVSLLLRLITSPTVPTYAVLSEYLTLTTTMLLNPALKAYPLFFFDASDLIATRSPTIFDMKLWKCPLFYWSMGAKHIL
jgi:hypothetical protein